jgi:hypothetical protein
MAGDFATSRDFFDRVEADVRPYLDEKAEATISEGVATTAVNQAAARYRATPVDRIMAAALNAVNHLALGDRQGARVQLNLARDWQDDAARRYASEEAPGGQVGGILERHYDGLEDLRAYAEYRNPFASHLRGVFLLAAGADQTDLDRARFELREVLAMEPDALPAVGPDLDRIERGFGPEPTTWVYFFAGRAPRLEELRLDLPILAGNVNYVAAAFPRLDFQRDGIGAMRIGAGGVEAPAVLLADVEAMVAQDFRRRLPTIIGQENASAGLKAAMTYGASEEGGSLAAILGLIYQAASTSADLRGWRTLPRHILLARVPTPEDGDLTVILGSLRQHVPVEPGQSHIVLITLPSTAAPRASVVAASLNARDREETADAN